MKLSGPGLLFVVRFFFKINKFIYLFLSVLGLHCCLWAFFSCDERGLLFVVVCGLLILVASLFADHGLWGLRALAVVACRLSSCNSRA